MGAGTRLEQEKDQPEEQALSKCVAIINAKSYYYSVSCTSQANRKRLK